MPAIRRFRLLSLTVIFIFVCSYYLISKGNVLSHDHSPFLPDAPTKAPSPGPTPVRVHWKARADRYPVTSHIPLPTGTPKSIPAVQAPAPKETKGQEEERKSRRNAVRRSFFHSWTGYKDRAWLRDEVAPISGGAKDAFGGWAATLVDSLDTLWIMGFKDDFEAAVNAANTIDFTTTDQEYINVFETTIRYLGGFLAAYDISDGKYPTLLEKAVQVGDLLMSCFDTPNRMPISRWDWKKYTTHTPQKAPSRMLVSELGSLSLEFTRLSQLTKNVKYYDAIQRISDEFEALQDNTMLPGMWPVIVNAANPGISRDGFFTLGGMSDSLYEYLPKQYLILGGLLSQPKTMYEKFIEVAKKQMFFRIYNPADEPLTVSGDVKISGVKPDTHVKLVPRGQHLTCFTGGMVALASKVFARPDDLVLAAELTNGCIWAYDSSANHIAPEVFSVMPCIKDVNCTWSEGTWHDALADLYSKGPAEETQEEAAARVKTLVKNQRLPPGFMGIEDRKYILRPEAIESVFIMYRATGEKKWADAAWRMFEAIESISKTKIAAAAIADVTVPASEVTQVNSMESFWLAETLKYFYLCFEAWDVVSLDEYVLNTEAHPLRRPK